MLYQITARILVEILDDDDDTPEHLKITEVTDGLNELFRSTYGWVADWAYDPDPTNPGERLVVRRDDLSPTDYEEGDFLNLNQHDAMQHDDCADCGTSWGDSESQTQR